MKSVPDIAASTTRKLILELLETGSEKMSIKGNGWDIQAYRVLNIIRVDIKEVDEDGKGKS